MMMVQMIPVQIYVMNLQRKMIEYKWFINQMRGLLEREKKGCSYPMVVTLPM